MLQKVLLAVDGSEPSTRAVHVTKEMAGPHAEIYVLHIKERDRGRGFGYELETSEEAAQIVESAVRELKDSGISAWGEVVYAYYGQAPREILTRAEHEDIDLIVMGSRGLSDLAGLVMGSVTHKVLHLAQIPVLVVR
jgi:nucleotide-binding universal stress UspA family protein